MQQQRTLRDAWLTTLTELGAAQGNDSLLIGPHAESLADQLPGPTGDTTPNVATLFVTPVPDGATPTATGFPANSFDSAVALSAWETPADVSAVAAEAVRVVRPGGTVWLGEIDARGLTRSTPAARRYGLLYRDHPPVSDAARFRFRAAETIGVDAVRVGLRPIAETRADFPVAVAESRADAVEAVRSGIWPGTGLLDATALDDLLVRVDESFEPPERFPFVFTLPWILVEGRRT
jgi:hypothetical protein